MMKHRDNLKKKKYPTLYFWNFKKKKKKSSAQTLETALDQFSIQRAGGQALYLPAITS